MVEMRLYYDDNGNVLFYTCDKPEGTFIVIDKDVYAACRFDIKILDGKIVKPEQAIVISKLVPGKEGVTCAMEDINIVVNNTYTGKTIKWELEQHEFKCN